MKKIFFFTHATLIITILSLTLLSPMLAYAQSPSPYCYDANGNLLPNCGPSEDPGNDYSGGGGGDNSGFGEYGDYDPGPTPGPVNTGYVPFEDFEALQNSPGFGYQGTQGQDDVFTHYFDGTLDSINANNPQTDAYSNGIKSTGAGATAGIGAGVQSASGCVSAAQVIRVAKEALIQANPSTRIKVNTVTTNSFSEAGESSVTSFDSIGYCLLNAIIEYVAKATIAWINSGFNGAPAYLSDPKRFFTGLADQQFAGFLRDFNQNGAGLNIPSQYRGYISQALVQGYTGATSGGGGGFGGGGSGILSSFGRPQYYGDFALRAGEEQVRRQTASVAEASQQLQFGQGFFPLKDPGKVTQTRDAQGNLINIRGNAQIATPAALSKDTLSKRTNGGFDRLLAATKFDQVVNSLVNALIKLVLSKVLKQ